MASTLSCQSCSEPFSDPRLLPCLHVFCKDCLEPLYKQDEGTITCPTCNKTISCKPPAELPRHLRIVRDSTLSTMQQNPQETLCGSCDENNKAEAYCEDCSSPICSDCVSSHKRLKAVKKHSVVSLTESRPVAGENVSCILHPEEAVKYYCSTCSYLVCSECLLTHKEHECGRIDNAELLKKEKDELQSVILKVEEAITPIVKTTETISEIVKHVGVNKDRAKEDINESFKRISETVEKRRLELIQETEDSAIAKSTRLNIQKEGLDKLFTNLQLALESGNAACKEYSSVQLFAVKGTIFKASSDIVSESRSMDHEIISNRSLNLAINCKKMIESVSTLGRIVMDRSKPSLCGLIGINPQLAIGVAKGTECVVILQTRDAKGKNLTEGTAKVLAKVTNPSSGSEVSECIVTDLDNGRYEIQFTNPTKGQHELSITIDEDNISNSPFTVNVRDYTAIKKPAASVSEHDRVGFVAISRENLYYVTGERESMLIYDSDLGVVKEFSDTKLQAKNLRGVAIDNDNGIMFVASAGSNRIVKASLEGEVIASVGGIKGAGELQFNSPMGLRLTRDGLLLVAGCNNKRIQVLTSDLSFVRFIPCHSGVYGVSVDCDDNIHAAVTNRVEVFNVTGEKITEYGHGLLVTATDVAFLPNSKCQYSFVTDHTTPGKIRIFDWSKNKLIHTIPGGKQPLGLAIDQEGTIVVCGWEDKKIICF